MHRNRRDDGKCRGSVYLHVLVSSLLISILGLGSLMAVRLQVRSVQLRRDSGEARAYAASAVEVGLLCIKQNASWRTAWPNGVWLQDKPLGNGYFTLEGVDPGDGVLSDSQYEPVVLTGTGIKGLARHKTQVTLVPVIKPMKVLNTCLHASGLIVINNGNQITVIGVPLSSNGNLTNTGTVDGDVEVNAANPVGAITGTLTTSTPTKPMPSSTLIDDYAAKATNIPYTGDISKAVLGPGCNPWGPTDPNALYVLDTGGKNLSISKTRIYGTLIIRAPNKIVTIQEAVLCQNYRAEFPVLIVEGNLVLKYKSADTSLSESVDATNYNPNGAPYNGISDSDTSDTYPNEIRGLIHVTGNLTLQETARIAGTIVCEGQVSCEGTNTIQYDTSLSACPPNGYTYVDGMAISPGSWKRVVD